MHKEVMNNIKDCDKEIEEVFNHWLSKDIIKHRKITDNIKRRIKMRLKESSLEEALSVVDNYAEVYHDEDYFFTYKFSLARLMHCDQYEKFAVDGEHYANYKDTQENLEKKEEIKNKVHKQIKLNNEIDELYKLIINKFNSMPYKEYLETEHWQHFRKEALKSANYKCQVCSKDSDNKLAVHHNNYDNRGRETFNDVVVLCDGCHELFHGCVDNE